jgi:hypothetical protein
MSSASTVTHPSTRLSSSLDEKTSIQALQRTQMPLPLRSGRAVRHTHDYKRHGVVDLYAALEVATGKVTHRLSEESHGDRLPLLHGPRLYVTTPARSST